MNVNIPAYLLFIACSSVLCCLLFMFSAMKALKLPAGKAAAFSGLVLLLGTPLFANFPAHGGALVITAWWGVWHIISGLTISTIFNYIESRKRLNAIVS